MQIETPDLGPKRGRLSDWTTQRWVQYTGRRVTLEEAPWLDGPVGDVEGIGDDFFERFAARSSLQVDVDSTPRGLLENFADLTGSRCNCQDVHPAIRRFYEQTSEYDFDVWSSWSGIFRPFGSLLAAIFSRRLQQLNVPLSPLDTSHGMSSRVLKLRDEEREVHLTAWVRSLRTSKSTLYAGSYSACPMPGFNGACVRVVFPLPNGHATVVMWPQSHEEGSFTLHSFGKRFGDPGFYFYVRDTAEAGWARYVPSFTETIHVFVDENSVGRADHTLRLFGAQVLKLHYRMRPVDPAPSLPRSV